MRSIEVLDKITIDKIAAGEVVERPASVIKELTENAIDANATAVTIEIKDGGTSLMRITDNGAGIPADQVRKAFLRHATSKIRTVEDLVQIASLGFRGEALSSISAVSQMECITKTPEALTGIRYVIEGGEEKEYEEIGAPTGTTFIVRNLFYNTPARAKFLKSAMAEANHVTGFVEELALSHPDISFKYIVNGQNRLYTSGNGNLKEIVYQIYGRDITRELIPINEDTGVFSVHGFLGNPNIARGNRSFENYFVNGRYVKSRILAKAIEDGYHGFLMQHKYPFTLLYLDLDGEKVDVNVHPSKMEVRFSDPETVYRQLCLAIQNALIRKKRIPVVSVDEGKKERGGPEKLPVLDGSRPEPFEMVRRTEEARTVQTEIPFGIEDRKDKAGSRSPSGTSFRVSEAGGTYTPSSRAGQDENFLDEWNREMIASGNAAGNVSSREAAPVPKKAGNIPAGKDTPAEKAEKPRQLELLEEDRVLSDQARRMYRLIGQVFDTYWLIEYRDSLYLIDQHAAHEKVNYERMMKAFREKTVVSQMIYPAIIVNLSAREAALLNRNLDAFEKMGYEVEDFGGNSFRITAVPANLYSVASDRLFTEILDQLDELGDISPEAVPERLASMSCKAAVKGNSRISQKEMEALIDELLTLENPYNCPHGRPTIISMSRYELDKKFKRIV